MFDVDSLLKNDSVKSILTKVGVNEAQAKGAVEQLVKTFQSKVSNDPAGAQKAMASNGLAGFLGNDFVKNLISKVGLSESKANELSAQLPNLLKSVQGDKGFDLNALASKFGLEDVLKNADSDGDGKPDVSGVFGALKKKFFG